MSAAGCANMVDNRIYICFYCSRQNYGSTSHYCYEEEDRSCMYAETPLGTFQKTAESSGTHSYSLVSANKGRLLIKLFQTNSLIMDQHHSFSDYVFTPGGNSNSAKTELYMPEFNAWSQAEQYPFSSKIYKTPIVNVDTLFHVFGGPEEAAIATFDTVSRSWSLSGFLKSGKK